MSAEPATAQSGMSYGRRFLILWIVASVILTPIVAIFVGPEIPPGNASVQASGQVTDNTVLVTVMTPVFLFIVLFVAFAISHFRGGAAEAGDAVADRGNSRIQVVWAVVTTVIVMSLAAFGA